MSSPRKASPSLAELVILVKVPGDYRTIRTFTEDERPQAQAYAAEIGGVIEDIS